jgi:hypothetical protein
MLICIFKISGTSLLASTRKGFSKKNTAIKEKGERETI